MEQDSDDESMLINSVLKSYTKDSTLKGISFRSRAKRMPIMSISSDEEMESILPKNLDTVKQDPDVEEDERIQLLVDEDSDDDEEIERSLSPQTRMSITGIRPEDLNSSSDDLFSQPPTDDDEEVKPLFPRTSNMSMTGNRWFLDDDEEATLHDVSMGSSSKSEVSSLFSSNLFQNHHRFL